MLLNGVCVVLHMCSHFTNYSKAINFWQSRTLPLRVFAVDSCRDTLSIHDDMFNRNLKHIHYKQAMPISHSRFKISELERDQMQSALRLLPTNCTFVVKLTGKYMPDNIHLSIASLPNQTMLALSSRGPSYGGYSSELFGMDRILFERSLNLWTDRRNTESFVERVRLLVERVDQSLIAKFHRLNLVHPSYRYTDKRKMTYL